MTQEEKVSLVPLRSPWLNHGGTTPDNPVLEDQVLKLKLSKHNADETLRQVWVTVGGVVFQKLTSIAVETDFEVTVDIVVGTHLQVGFPAVRNVIRFTTSDHRQGRAIVWASSVPPVLVTLDGYDAQDPAKPLIYPLYDPGQVSF